MSCHRFNKPCHDVTRVSQLPRVTAVTCHVPRVTGHTLRNTGEMAQLTSLKRSHVTRVIIVTNVEAAHEILISAD